MDVQRIVQAFANTLDPARRVEAENELEQVIINLQTQIPIIKHMCTCTCTYSIVYNCKTLMERMYIVFCHYMGLWYMYVYYISLMEP